MYLATPTKPKSFANPGDPLAVKVYKAEILKQHKQVERIETEFKVGSQLAHPNVVRMYEYDVKSKDPYLVMEYVDGITLQDLGMMFHPMPQKLVLHVTTQLAKGIQALHSGGVIHRDIKPENVIVSSAFAVKLMDLGVVRPPKDLHRVTPPHKFLGTIRNAAPEYLFGGDADEASDLYSFGTTLFFLLHGEQVFADEDQFARVIQLVRDQAPAIDVGLEREGGVAGKLSAICQELLRKRPGDRVSSVERVLEKLMELETELAAPFEEAVHAYLATALTGLPRDGREAITFTGSKIADVCKKFDVYVYQPRRATDPVRHRDISPAAVYLLDRRRVTAAGLLVVLGNYPSFGVGQELEIAASFGKPTLMIRHEEVAISRMVRGSYANFVGDELIYSHPEDLDAKLKKWLQANVSRIQAWSGAFRRSIPSEFGLRLAELREKAEFSVSEAAERIGLSARMLEALERQPLSFHNVGVQTLYRMCYLYGVDIRDVLSAGPRSEGVPPDDRNLRELERIAARANWLTSDFLALRKEYEKEVAGRDSRLIVGADGWMRRHEALQRRRLEGSEGA